MAGCAVSDDSVQHSQNTAELGAITNNSAFTLFLTTEVAPQDKVDVTSSDGTPLRSCTGGCAFAYLAGSVLTLRVPFPNDKVNCIHFTGWSGACSGQGNPCTLVLNSDLTTEAIWANTIGCQPQ
ncbi:MAG TPA: hypothetical protein VFT22_36615 [Kofleriaceae bacterium]|nr:hypothetical protein [Kofleriaceae bacterium]